MLAGVFPSREDHNAYFPLPAMSLVVVETLGLGGGASGVVWGLGGLNDDCVV